MPTPQEERIQDLLNENEILRYRLREAEETLDAISKGEVDALFVSGPLGRQVYTLTGADQAYRILFETMNEGAAVLSSDGTALFCNAALCEMLKTPHESVMGSSLDRFLAEADDKRLFARLLETGLEKPQKTEIVLRSHDGNPVPCLMSASPFVTENTSAICVIFTDLTERNNAEKALKESEEAFRSVFENSLDGILLTAPDGAIFKANKAACDILGRSEQEMWDLGRASVVDTDDPRLGPALNERLQRGRFRGELNYLRMDGNTFPVELSSAVYKDSRGNPRACIIFRDITERKQAEEELRSHKQKLEQTVGERTKQLRESEEKFRLFMDNSPTIAWMKDDLGRHVYLSGTYEKRFGVRLDDWAGKTDFELWPREIAEAFWKNDQAVLAAGHAMEVNEETADSEGNITSWLNFKFPVQDSSGQRYVAGIGIDITDRKKAEAALERTRKMLEEAQKIAHLGSFEYIAATQTTVWSEEEYRIYGLDPAGPSPTYDSMLQRSIHPDDAALLHETFMKAMQNRSVYELEHRIVLPDGSVRWVYDRAYPYFDKQGDLVRYVGTTLDITDRKKNEEALRESEERLAFVLQGSRDGFWDWDLETGTVQRNERWAEMLGYSSEDMSRTVPQWEDLVHPEDKPRAWQSISDHLEGKTDRHECEYRMLTKSCEWRWILDRARVVKLNAYGKPARMAGTHTDITERKELEAALKNSEERLRLALEAAKAGAWEWNLQTNENIWSDELWGLYGLKPHSSEPSYDAWLQTVHPDDRFAAQEAVQNASSTGTELRAEWRVRGFHDPERWLMSRGRPICDDRGLALSYLGVVIDITERKQAEAELKKSIQDLERSNSELQQFAYVASHDLQEPLRMVSSYTQLLAQRYGDQLDEKGRKYIGYAVEGAVRMHQLINDLLSFSRVTSRGAELKPIHSQEALGMAMANLRETIRESGAAVTHDDLPPVMADRTQLAQVFQNLISNAIKFQDKGPPMVHISARGKGRRWVFSVKDNGIGIDPRHKHKMFVIFKRLHTRREYPGTGIGLALCQRIIHRHGGEIWFESQPGQGTTFYFTLPKRKLHGEDNGPQGRLPTH